MQKIDLWHYPRKELAEQILGMFESGLSSALVFFAPRRMGKTEFLCKDMAPLAEKKKWKVFYFSFLDVGKNATIDFTKGITDFATKQGTLKSGGILKKISKIGGGVGGITADIELKGSINAQKTMKEIIDLLCKDDKLLLLLDEVQILSHDPANAKFIASLRTILDINKTEVKVIFTGSSQEGLRKMFSQSNAPFFHFGQNLPFPEFEVGFTDHLAQNFEKVTKRKLNRNELWKTFLEMQKVPHLARTLVERMALNPSLSIGEAKTELMSQIFSDRAFAEIWDQCSILERLLLLEISNNTGGLFSTEVREKFAKKMGLDEVAVSSLQSALRVLHRKNLIGRVPEKRGYIIDDPNFKNWIKLFNA
jgi:hypothetical protein